MYQSRSLAGIKRDTSRRASLAQERSDLWLELAALQGERVGLERMGAANSAAMARVEQRQIRLSSRVQAITAWLNGHAYDIGGPRPPFASTGGLYEQKRYDRVRVEVQLKLHEFFLNNQGQRMKGR